MPLLETLRQEYDKLGPQVAAADEKILAALAVKEEAAVVYDEAKAAVRELKKVRDPLRVEQMQLARAVGDFDPDTPDTQVITNAGPDDPDVQMITPDDVETVNFGGE